MNSIITNLTIHYGTKCAAHFINRTIEYFTATSHPRAHNSVAHTLTAITPNKQSFFAVPSLLIPKDPSFIDHLSNLINILAHRNSSLSHQNIFLRLVNTYCKNSLINFNRFRGVIPISLALTHKLEFTRMNMLLIKINTVEECKNLIKFIKNENNLELIETIEFGDIKSEINETFQELLNLLAQKSKQMVNLRSLSCRDIYEDVTLPPELIYLKFFSCSSIVIAASLTIKKLPKLRFFSCQFINGTLTLEVPNLKSLSLANIHNNAILTLEAPNLETISCKNLFNDVTLLSNELMLKQSSFGNTIIISQGSISFITNRHQAEKN